MVCKFATNFNINDVRHFWHLVNALIRFLYSLLVAFRKCFKIFVKLYSQYNLKFVFYTFRHVENYDKQIRKKNGPTTDF